MERSAGCAVHSAQCVVRGARCGVRVSRMGRTGQTGQTGRTGQLDRHNALRCKRLTMLNPRLQPGVGNPPKTVPCKGTTIGRIGDVGISPDGAT